MIWGWNENVQAISAILGVFVLLPLAIVTYRDGVRRFALEAPHKSTHVLFLGMPIRLLGALSITIGAAILGWVAYNLVIEKQKEFTGISSISQLGLPVLLVVLGWRWFRSPLVKQRDDEAA